MLPAPAWAPQAWLIMPYEVAPLQPDIVVMYTGGAQLILEAFGFIDVQWQSSACPGSRIIHYSALAVRINGLTGYIMRGADPSRPRCHITQV